MNSKTGEILSRPSTRASPPSKPESTPPIADAKNHRPNIWPIQDIGLLRAISNNYKKKYHPPKYFVNKLNKKFTPYCTVATWYLWRSIDDEPIQY